MNGRASDFPVMQKEKAEKSRYPNLLVAPSLGFSSNGTSVAKMKNGYHEKKTVKTINTATMHLPVMEPEEDEDATGDLEASMSGVLVRYRKYLIERSNHLIGYPLNTEFDLGPLSQFLNLTINNAGDPFMEGHLGVHSRPFEIGVLDWFARLWEIESNEYWGYVTNGGTEGNMHGILVGRELFPDGILYASRDSHYSVFKAARMYRMECVEINSSVSGEIDYDDFGHKLQLNKDKAAIINVNIGTTVKGAVDDIDMVVRTLEENGFNQNRFYIHCDGALFGIMIPFCKMAPKLSFKKPIGSISVSGHKFIGCPLSCGVLITRRGHINVLSKSVEYLATEDATIMGSRSGHAPIFLWYTLNHKGHHGLHKEVKISLTEAQNFKDSLRSAGISAMLNEFSNTVVFERPHDDNFSIHWQLACQGKIAHVVVMPSVDAVKLDAFLDELILKRQVWYQEGKLLNPCVADEIGPKNCMCALHI